MQKTSWTVVGAALLAAGAAACTSGGGNSDTCKAGNCGSPAGMNAGGSSGASAGAPSSGGHGGGSGGSAPSSGGSGGVAGAAGSGGSGGGNPGGSGGGSIAGGAGSLGAGNGGAATAGSSSGGGNGGASSGGMTAMAGSGTAGTATGGAGAGTGPTAIELVTSAENAYWMQGQVTTLTSGTADFTVDPGTKYQRWDGFGGCFNEMGWDALSVVSTDDVTKAMKLLFDPVDGANFIYGRLPMGASDYSMSWYTLDDTTGDYSMNDFSIDRDRQKLIPFIKAALAIRPDIKLWASPWVVPAWMMDSAKNMKNDAQTLGAHALYMSRFVEEYAKEGLKIVAIHPQNEPGYAQVHWTQAEFIDFIKTYLGPTFAQRNITAEIWCGTMSKDPDDTNIAKAAAADTDAMKFIKGFGVQWNLEAAVSTLAQSGPVMQTEHRCGNYSFDSPYWDKSRYNPKMPQNDHLYGEESWQLIRDWIVAGVNSYAAWNMVLDTVGMSLGNWPQNALLTVDRSAGKLNVTAAYYAFRHYSRYIAVGATRIGTTGDDDALSFQNPDGSIVIEVYNKGASSQQTTVGVGSAGAQSLYQFDVPSHGWATLVLPKAS
jgi:glucosylceramidase